MNKIFVAAACLVFSVCYSSPSTAEDCNQNGLAFKTGVGQCPAPTPAGLMKQAETNAQKRADESCGKNKKCEGKATPEDDGCIDSYHPKGAPFTRMWYAMANFIGICSK